MSAEPPYDHAGPSIRASDEVNGLLREQKDSPAVFPAFLEPRNWSRRLVRFAGTLLELLDVDDQGVVTLGASYNRGGPGAPIRQRTFCITRSGGYYVALRCISFGCHRGRKTFDARVAWRYDFRRLAGFITRSRTAWLGVSDD